MIYAIGIGPGDPQFLPLKSLEILKKADVISGFETVLNYARSNLPATAELISLNYRNQKEKLKEVGNLSRKGKTCFFCFMGDLSFSGYEFLQNIKTFCEDPDPVKIPGISSAQIAATRASIPFEDSVFITFHKAAEIEKDKEFLVHALKLGKSAIIIPRPPDFMPEQICRFLEDEGVPPETTVQIFEYLTLENEKHYKFQLGNCRGNFSDMSIIVLQKSL
ncbi:MAG: precorrin-6y C5,15-methyltransferase (decarboxylating) subunit CbiE [Nitrospinota bacterium]